MDEAEGERTAAATITQLPCKPKGRQLLLGGLDSKVQMMLKGIRVNGGAMNTRGYCDVL